MNLFCFADNMKDAIAAKLCAQADEYYAEVMKHIQKEACRNIWDSTWLPLISGKQAAFHGLAEYFQSLVCKQNKSIGEEIARLQKSMELFKAAQSRSGKPLFQDFIGKVCQIMLSKFDDQSLYYIFRRTEKRRFNYSFTNKLVGNFATIQGCKKFSVE